jgi:hypothetical protein
MRKLSLKLCGLALLVGAQGAYAYDYNCDLKNLSGRDAFDVAVVLNGSETVTSTFDGYNDGSWLQGHFYNVTKTPTAAGDTVIHWMNMEKNDSPIIPGKTIHVGWSTKDCKSTVKDMYWTGKDHQPLPGGVVQNTSWGITYYKSRFPFLSLGNAMDAKYPIVLRNLRFLVVDRPLPLEALASNNLELMAALQPVSDEPIVVEPGRQVNIPLPVEVAPGQAVIAFYESDEAAEFPSAARVGNFVQQANINPCAASVRPLPESPL